ncbi:MAG: hypothetical protein WBE34_21670, partial [Candidatus Nitrosopolaris sp.]
QLSVSKYLLTKTAPSIGSIGTISFLRNEPQTDSRVSIIHGYADHRDPTRSLPSGKCKKLDKC